MDSIDRALLNVIQSHFPITVHPYQVLGLKVGTMEEDAFRRIQRLRQEGIIRRLGGIFDSRRLGYYSTLCAAKVPEEKIPALAELLAGVSGVTHNYLRNHEYNIWFTLIARSQVVAERILQNIRDSLKVPEIYSLPAIRVFKIKVDLDLNLANQDSSLNKKIESVPDASLKETEANLNILEAQDGSLFELKGFELRKEDIALVKVLQANLPDSLTPYSVLAENLHWSVEDVISGTMRLKEAKVMRRFGAVLRHQKAGFVANTMGVWQVEPEQAAQAGKIMASFKEVSHCYQRPTLPDWPYSFFTMIHGRSVQACEEVMKRISLSTGISNYAMLFSIAELKKTSMQYFLEEETN
ncbi:MAG: Lrp/AsnC family transcriptional regulator [Desulfosporosinus sp.]